MSVRLDSDCIHLEGLCRVEDAEPDAPYGVKGVGEAGTVGSLVATINAVCDALGPLGITHIEMPASPARIWQAIECARKAKAA